jgi:hypothetical protein
VIGPYIRIDWVLGNLFVKLIECLFYLA